MHFYVKILTLPFCREILPVSASHSSGCMENNKEKQLQFDRNYLEMARIWSKNSYCIRRKVGALLVKDRMIISDGYNGTPAGFENECEDENNVTKSYVLHAEANAITKVAKSGNSSQGSTLYITDSPCLECAKLIIQAGIVRVVYSDSYRKSEGLDLLRKANIEVVQINIGNDEGSQ
jgi:dCMP deaminase